MNDKGKDIVDGRADIPMYGGAVENMENVALMWTGYLAGRTVITGPDVAMMMVLSKAYRFGQTPDYSDNIDDVEGYAGIARDGVGIDMIEAETPAEYRKLKAQRERHARAAAEMVTDARVTEHLIHSMDTEQAVGFAPRLVEQEDGQVTVTKVHTFEPIPIGRIGERRSADGRERDLTV